MQKLDDQTFTSNKEVWRITRLIKLSEELKPFEIPMEHLNIYNLYPVIKSTNEFVEHVRQVNEAELKFPIILDEEGYVMDGRHRIAKAILEKKSSILAVRFKKTPNCCYIKD